MSKDITIIIPVHEKEIVKKEAKLVERAVNCVRNCQNFYNDGKLIVTIVAPFKDAEMMKIVDNWILNDSDNTTYCGQVNYAVQHIDTKYFSVLAFDDIYTEKWFKFFNDYLYGNEDVSAFLPLNIVTDVNGQHWQYGNEAALAEFFSSELGFLDFDSLQDWSGFSLMGAVINREDFISVGMYKPSIKIAFDYELLLRMTNKKLRVMVVPKEGYKRIVGRENSMTDQYRKEMEGTNDMQKWFELAKREYTYTEDRKKGISKKQEVEEVK